MQDETPRISESLDAGPDPQAPNPQAEVTQAQANIYRFLSRLLVREPDEELIESVFNDEVLAALGEVFAETVVKELQTLCTGWDAEWDLKALRLDYWGLFEVPGKRYLAPYESVYRQEGHDRSGQPTGRLFGPSTAMVLRAYWEAGMQISQNFLDLPDHIGAEIEFVAYLAERETDTWTAGDIAQAEAYREKRETFIREHLNLWIEDVAARMLDRSRTPLYRATARMLAELPHIPLR